MLIRDARDDDLPAMLDIYAAHVTRGLGSFEETPPSLDAFTGRWSGVRESGLHWLVAEADREVAGYGYVVGFRPRSGYRFTVEDSVYVAPERQGRGVGRSLLAGLIERCEALGLRQMTAAIGDSANAASIALHHACGFDVAGVLRAVGFKHERWVDVVLMQRSLGQGEATAPNGAGWRLP